MGKGYVGCGAECSYWSGDCCGRARWSGTVLDSSTGWKPSWHCPRRFVSYPGCFHGHISHNGPSLALRRQTPIRASHASSNHPPTCWSSCGLQRKWQSSTRLIRTTRDLCGTSSNKKGTATAVTGVGARPYIPRLFAVCPRVFRCTVFRERKGAMPWKKRTMTAKGAR